MTGALEKDWTDEIAIEHPYDRVMAELERAIGARCELRISDPPRGRLLAHCRYVQGMISGYMDVRVDRRAGGTLVRLMARPYDYFMGSPKGTPRTFGELRRSVLEDVRGALEGTDRGWDARELNETTLSTPPRRLARPDPWPALKWTLVAAVGLAAILVVFSTPYLNDGLEYLWPYYLLAIPPPFVSALLIRAGHLRAAKYLLDCSGFITILVLFLPTFGMTYALVIPMAHASQNAHEAWYWGRFHDEMEAPPPLVGQGLPVV